MRGITILILAAAVLFAVASPPASAGPAQSGPKNNRYYSFAYGVFAYSEMEQISTKNGTGDPVWSLGVEFVGDGVTSVGWTPFGLAFDVDGTMYITQNIISFDPSLVRSQLARVDSQTGEVTPIGDPVPFNTSGPDIDADGNMYVCGFQVEKGCHLGAALMRWQNHDNKQHQAGEIGFR